jgi:hypothetical protein
MSMRLKSAGKAKASAEKLIQRYMRSSTVRISRMSADLIKYSDKVITGQMIMKEAKRDPQASQDTSLPDSMPEKLLRSSMKMLRGGQLMIRKESQVQITNVTLR